MDLTRIRFIKNCTIDQLTNEEYIQTLMVALGFNNEILREQPQLVKNNGGGLLIWQYPNQFSKYLLLLSRLDITSYIEIGCRWGGTFVLTNEYLKRFQSMRKSVAVDIIDSPVLNYCMDNVETQFLKVNSTSEEFKKYMKKNFFDLVFIDGDHSYQGVKNDYECSKHSGRIFVFHDIVNDACPGVSYFWNELKHNEASTYEFHEFTEQYDEVFQDTQQQFLGIGVAIKKQ